MDNDTSVQAFVLSSCRLGAQMLRSRHRGNHASSSLETESSGSVPSLDFDHIFAIPQKGSVATVASLQDGAQMKGGSDEISIKTMEPANDTCQDLLLPSAAIGSRDSETCANKSSGTCAVIHAAMITRLSEAGHYEACPLIYKESNAKLIATTEKHAGDHLPQGAGQCSSARRMALISEKYSCSGKHAGHDLCPGQRSAKDFIETNVGDENYACEEVAKRLACNKGVYRPMLALTGENPHACSKCRQRASFKVSVRRTREMDHIGKKPCLCDKRLQAIKRRPLQSSSGDKPEEGDDYGRQSSADGKLEEGDDYGRQSSVSDKPEEGDDYGRQSSEKSHMTTDMLTHSREKPHVCCECGHSFLHECSLRRHMLTHGQEMPHSCGECGRRFLHKGSMKRHMLTHTWEKPHMCSECGQRFSIKDNMVRHMLAHTGEKPHICSECGQRFTIKSHMTRHMLTHTGEKPHACNECGQWFSRKSHITRHMLTHTKEKPHVCSECGRRFSDKNTMMTHMVTHTGEKPYMCNGCGQRFVRKSSLTRHVLARMHGRPQASSECAQRCP